MATEIETQLQTLAQSAQKEIESSDSLAKLEELRINYLGKKGELSQILRGMGKLSPEERPRIGAVANQIKEQIQNILTSQQDSLQQQAIASQISS